MAKARKREISKQEAKALKELGHKVMELAAKKKISIERLAYEADISKGYLYDIAQGQGNPSLVILLRLADALETDLREILK